MALLKTDANEYGQTGEYHKIVAMRDSRIIPEIVVTVHLYFNRENQNKPIKVTNYVFNNIPVDMGGDDPVILRPYFMNIEELSQAGMDPVKLAYRKLKLLLDFEGSINVLEPGQTP